MSSDLNDIEDATFFTILPIVTGEGEALFLPQMLRSLMDTGRCCFTRPRKFEQLRPLGPQRRLEMVGRGRLLTTRQEELGLIARRFLGECDSHLVLFVDDLEQVTDEKHEVFKHYRESLDRMLSSVGLADRAAVHFMVKMVEAYFFADAAAINAILNSTLEDFDGDPETIGHPKGKLKQIAKSHQRSFDEKADGQRVAERLDLAKVLFNAETCASLRSLVKWCSRRIGDPDTDRFQLICGAFCPMTGVQIPNESATAGE